jgi:ribosomal-protein-alanine N-acetyltransferase
LLPREFDGGRLRRLRPADLPAFQAYRALPECGRYQGWVPMPEAEALAFLADMEAAPLFAPGQWVQLGIADPLSDRLIGDVGLHLAGDGAAGEVGFTLAPWAQGRGIAGRAVREAVDVFFALTRATHVDGVADARNLPSLRLLARLGFARVETRPAVFRGEACVEEVRRLRRDARPWGDGRAD